MIKQALLLLLSVFSLTTHAHIIFEGYYRIEVKGVHRGYVIQRHEYDEAKKERTMSYFVWRKDEGNITQSGVKAVSREDLRPLRYSLYEYINGKSTITNGTFGPKNLVVTKLDGRTNKVIEAPDPIAIPPIAIFSSYITQILAKSYPADYKDGLYIAYMGFAEENMQFNDGTIRILRSNPFENQMIYQVLSTFMNEDIELFTFRSGEMLGSRSDNLDSVTYLTANKEEAVGDFKLATEAIKKIFGDVPHGATNNPVGQSGGKINAKEVIKFFPKVTDKDRKPNAKTPPKPLSLKLTP